MKYTNKQPTSNGRQPAKESIQPKSTINQPKPRSNSNDQLCQCIPTFSEYKILKQQIGPKNFAANFPEKNLAASQKIFFLPLVISWLLGHNSKK